MNKLVDKLGNIFESGFLYCFTIALALLAWWFGMLRQFIAWYLGIGFVIFIAVMVWGYWEGRPEKPIPHKVALTIGWFYLFITVNLLMVGEPVDSTGWLNPTHAVGAVFIAIFYPFIWLYRLLFS